MNGTNFSKCWKRIKSAASSLLFGRVKTCMVCGRDIPEGAVCPKCARELRRHWRPQKEMQNGRALYSCYAYGGSVRALVLRYKMQGRPWLADALAEPMTDLLLAHEERFWLITYVPLSARRQTWRGYNQAELLAREIGRRMNLPVAPLLRRARKTKVQSRLSAQKREENLKGAFALEEGAELMAGQRILLVDDIATTGATLRECSAVLEQAGASVAAAVFARA